MESEPSSGAGGGSVTDDVTDDGPSVEPPSDAGPEAGPSDPAPAEAGADAGLVAPQGLGEQIPEFDDIPSEERLAENPFRITADMPASTFSIDVDTGSYTLTRAAINGGMLPSPDTVRIEEFINYFHLHYEQPPAGTPFSIYSEIADCPWNPENQLMMVGIQGEEVALEDQPPANLVFLLDISGSMNQEHKLPLLKKGFRMAVRQLRDIDMVSIVVYAGAERVILEGATGDDKELILEAIDDLQAGGSTNGEGGIQKAYEIAQEYFVEGGNNRVLLGTDGDFNVGISATEDLVDFIAEKRETGVFLSVYGFGSPTGNYQDEVAEQLADNGNGIYFFIDSPEEARRAFIHTITGSLLTVAKDVKLQLQFNEDQVKGYRLVGYENRVLSNADFANDSVDAGELGAGLSVTAFFELIAADSDQEVPIPVPGTDPLDDVDSASDEVELVPVTGDDLVDVRIRYKGADADSSELISNLLTIDDIRRDEASLKFWFGSAVAEVAMQLRGSQYLPERRDIELLEQIKLAFPADAEGAVQEFYDLTASAYEL
jgi:Ca-activated chloride channel family protein